MFKYFYGLAPRYPLRVIYLAKIKYLALDDLVALGPMILNNTPVAMFFPVLYAALRSKKHAPILAEYILRIKGVGRHYKPFSPPQHRKINGLYR
jgi:hypothetical protein